MGGFYFGIQSADFSNKQKTKWNKWNETTP